MSEVTETAQATTTAEPNKEAAPTATSTNPAEGAKVEPTVEAPAETKVDPTKETEEKPADKKAEETSKAPEKYELKLSKDSPLDNTHIAKVEAEAKAQGLTQEQAQKLLERDEATLTDSRAQQIEMMKSQQVEWRTEAETDKEIAGPGGKHFKENVELAQRALSKYADDSFKKVLSQTGLGNNPHLIRTFLRIGKAMAEDKANLDGKSGAPEKKKSRESKLYPTMKHEE